MSEEAERQGEPFVTVGQRARSEERPSEVRVDEGDHSRLGRQVGYVVAIVINLVLLYVFHNLLRWNVRFLTEDWNAVLPYLDASIWGTIAANAAWVFYDVRWFRRLLQIGLNLLGIRVMYAMYTVFPFQIELYAMNLALKIAFLAAMVALGIALVAELVGLVFGKNRD